MAVTGAGVSEAVRELATVDDGGLELLSLSLGSALLLELATALLVNVAVAV